MAKCKKSIVADLKNDLGSLMDFFINYKTAEGNADRTIRDYKITFTKFKEVYNSDEIDSELLKIKILEFFNDKRNKAPATYNRPYSNLHCFFEWCVHNSYLEKNPINELELKKRKDEGKVRHVDEKVIEKLLNLMDLTVYSGLRDYSIIVLTLDTGIRPSEAFSLKISDINFISSSITIRRESAKTRVERTLPIMPQTLEILKRLISVKPEDWDDYLFFTAEGNRMTTSRWEKRLQVYSEKLNYKITPYMLRHTFAILFLRNKGSAFALQMQLGHTDLSMTKRYVRLTESDIRQQHTLASPVNSFIKRTTRVQKLFKNK